MRALLLSSRNLKPLAAPMAPPWTFLDTLRPSQSEDMATLESDRSAAPEAEMAFGRKLELNGI